VREEKELEISVSSFFPLGRLRTRNDEKGISPIKMPQVFIE
jgi:hypothetical protein